MPTLLYTNLNSRELQLVSNESSGIIEPIKLVYE